MAIQNLNSNVDFAFGEKLLSAEMNLIKQNADDIKVGTNISADANITINLSNGTTYRVTMTATGVRVIALPLAPPANSRASFKLQYASGGNDLQFRVDNGTYTGQMIVVVGTSGTVEGWLELYWDGSTWRTATRNNGTGLTFTVTQ